MYIDLDTGTLQFGSDTEFFGTAFIGIRSDTPLFPMVTASGKGAIVGIVYRGKGQYIIFSLNMQTLQYRKVKRL